MAPQPTALAPTTSSLSDTPGRPVFTETRAWSVTGWFGVAGIVALGYALERIVVQLALYPRDEAPQGLLALVVGVLLVIVLLASGLTIVMPGRTQVVQFFGKYVGTIRNTGLQLTVPLSKRRTVSVRVRNFETNELKVNDADGNPVNIAAIVVWQVDDTAKASYAVENFDTFVQVQAESALRHIATSHPYDNAAPGEETLRGSTDVVAAELAAEVSARIAVAGLEVVETRISSLAYAPEIAGAMLQRQQATAVLAARSKIVEGAVTMVQSALERLEGDEIVVLDDERKAAMVTNLLVVLCGESRATPVVNTGTIYP